MNSAQIMTQTEKAIEKATVSQRRHLKASLNFQGELDFNQAKYHLNKAKELGADVSKILEAIEGYLQYSIPYPNL